jgi:hypothetical protein
MSIAAVGKVTEVVPSSVELGWRSVIVMPLAGPHAGLRHRHFEVGCEHGSGVSADACPLDAAELVIGFEHADVAPAQRHRPASA